MAIFDKIHAQENETFVVDVQWNCADQLSKEDNSSRSETKMIFTYRSDFKSEIFKDMLSAILFDTLSLIASRGF